LLQVRDATSKVTINHPSAKSEGKKTHFDEHF